MDILVIASQSEGQVLVPRGKDDASILALRHILRELPAVLHVSACAVKYVVVVGTIENQQPFAISFVGQPVEYKLENIDLGLIATYQFDFIGNRLEPFDEAGLRTSMNPKHPCSSRMSRKPVGEFDGQLGLAVF
jgi:hypothetical protein